MRQEEEEFHWRMKKGQMTSFCFPFRVQIQSRVPECHLKQGIVIRVPLDDHDWDWSRVGTLYVLRMEERK